MFLVSAVARRRVVNEGCYQYESGRTGKVSECRIRRGAGLLNLRCVADEVKLWGWKRGLEGGLKGRGMVVLTSGGCEQLAKKRCCWWM